MPYGAFTGHIFTFASFSRVCSFLEEIKQTQGKGGTCGRKTAAVHLRFQRKWLSRGPGRHRGTAVEARAQEDKIGTRVKGSDRKREPARCGKALAELAHFVFVPPSAGRTRGEQLIKTADASSYKRHNYSCRLLCTKIKNFGKGRAHARTTMATYFVSLYKCSAIKAYACLQPIKK